MVVIGLLILAVLILITPFNKSLVFEYQDTGKILAFYPIKNTNHFSIRYIHSIHLTPVQEFYTIKGKHIVQTKLTYENFAIGMPSHAQGNETFTQKGKTYILSNMNRSFPYVDLRVGQVVSNHTLIISHHQYPIHAFTGKGMWVRIRVHKINLWEMMKGVNILERQDNKK
ncbi:hypothetical protein EV207_14817 [Scopulibacillus darangshiensis]|uniref:RocC n=2 Tax=Scopulibacillus darangshiensis TaxID=442528 RepID=A0A4R2NHW9_9BACL|nr:hypothetical protein EV207_14817 [Scopulibacillus darangshiensis]